MRRSFTSTVFGVALALVLVPAASAHGIHGDGSGGVVEYLQLGWRHMLTGWDHLLFITGIVILATSVKLAVELLTAFALGHSLTLLVATLAGWQVNPEVVDILIGASVAYVGWRLLRGQPRNWRATAVIVFGFGLVHGLGLAARLQQLDLPDGGGLVARVISFNIGVEIGQIVAVAVLFGLGALGLSAWRALPRFEQGAGAMLTTIGLLLVAVLSFDFARPDAEAQTVEAVPALGCIERDPPRLPALSGGHPQRTFYGPGESADEADLSHVLGDRYVVIRYHRSLSRTQVERLRRWWRSANPVGLVVAPAPANADYRLAATTNTTQIACGHFALDKITRFRTEWADTARRQAR